MLLERILAEARIKNVATAELGPRKLIAGQPFYAVKYTTYDTKDLALSQHHALFPEPARAPITAPRATKAHSDPGPTTPPPCPPSPSAI